MTPLVAVREVTVASLVVLSARVCAFPSGLEWLRRTGGPVSGMRLCTNRSDTCVAFATGIPEVTRQSAPDRRSVSPGGTDRRSAGPHRGGAARWGAVGPAAG